MGILMTSKKKMTGHNPATGHDSSPSVSPWRLNRVQWLDCAQSSSSSKASGLAWFSSSDMNVGGRFRSQLKCSDVLDEGGSASGFDKQPRGPTDVGPSCGRDSS